MPIPVNPIYIENAAAYNVPISAIPMNLCKQPKEGLKCVPMQFLFSENALWKVDLSIGTPPPLSQICSIYIDCLNSTHDCIVVFPDTGYIAQCAAGKSTLAPCLTGVTLPLFFVYLVGGINATDYVNIFAVNQFIPHFSAP